MINRISDLILWRWPKRGKQGNETVLTDCLGRQYVGLSKSGHGFIKVYKDGSLGRWGDR